MKLRYWTIVLMAALFCVSNADARRKKPKAGEIKDNIYTDAVHGFKLVLPQDWKAKVHDKDDNFRLTLVQKSFEVPTHYLDAPDYTYTPKLTVFVAKSNMGVFPFLDSLLSESYSDDVKTEMMKEFVILSPYAGGDGVQREPTVTRKKKPVKINEEKGIEWNGKSNYVNNVTLSASAQGGKRVSGDYQGGIVLMPLDDETILAFHLMCEGQYFRGVWAQLLPLIEAVTW